MTASPEWQVGRVHTTIDSATEVVSGIRFPEGNRWHDGRLWYSDMHTGEVFSVDPGAADARPRLETTIDGQSSGLGWLADGRLIVSAMNARTIQVVRPDGSNEPFADLSSTEPSLLNDLVVDEATGRTYVGAFGYDLYGGENSARDRSTSSTRTAPPGSPPTAWCSRTARTCSPARGPWWSARPGVVD